jgi:drug/metabolite transporter (DMT)-like permease
VGFSEVHLNYKGIMLAFISGITYAIYIVEAGHSEIKNMDSLVLAFYLCVFSSLGILIIGGATRSLRFTATYRGWGAVFGIVIVCTVAACIAFNKGIKIIGSSRAAILSTLEPITSMILGVIIFGDVLCMNYLIGSIFIIISVVVLITPSNRKRIRKPTY